MIILFAYGNKTIFLCTTLGEVVMETSSTTDILSLQLPGSLNLKKWKHQEARELSEKPADILVILVDNSNLD